MIYDAAEAQPLLSVDDSEPDGAIRDETALPLNMDHYPGPTFLVSTPVSRCKVTGYQSPNKRAAY